MRRFYYYYGVCRLLVNPKRIMRSLRTAMSSAFSTQSRSTQGVRLMRLADSSRVVAVTTTEKIEETDEEASADASAALPEADPNDPDTAAPDDLSYAGDEDRDIARLLERAEEDGDI